MRFHFYRHLIFGLILLLPFIQTCKKPGKKITEVHFIYSVDYSADNKILAYAKLQGTDTVEQARYIYLDSLVRCIKESKGFLSSRKWYHLAGKYAWYSVDSIFYQGVFAEFNETWYAHDNEGFCRKQTHRQAYLYNGTMTYNDPVVATYDSIINGNVELYQLRFSYWCNSITKFWDISASIRFEDLRDQFIGRKNKNLPRFVSGDCGYKGATHDEYNYGYRIDPSGFLLETEELKSSSDFVSRNEKSIRRIRTTSNYQYHLR